MRSSNWNIVVVTVKISFNKDVAFAVVMHQVKVAFLRSLQEKFRIADEF